MHIRVICCGNPLVADEGVGIHTYNELRKLELPKNVELVDGGTLGLGLLPYIEKAEKIILVDAVKSGNRPGKIYRLREEDLRDTNLSFISLHNLKLEHVLKMARNFFGKLPEIIIIGIEIEKIKEFHIGLTPKVKRAVPKVVGKVLEEIKQDSGKEGLRAWDKIHSAFLASA